MKARTIQKNYSQSGLFWVYSIDGADLLFFALVLPLAQLALFAWIVVKGITNMTKVLENLSSLIDTLGEALVEEKQAYRRVRELIEELQKDGRFNR